MIIVRLCALAFYLGVFEEANCFYTPHCLPTNMKSERTLLTKTTFVAMTPREPTTTNGDEHCDDGNDDMHDESPVLTFGVIADVQYAPIDDGFSFTGTPRYYRHALDAAREAAEHFQREGVDFVVNLGDTIDGKCTTEAIQDDVDVPKRALSEVLDALSAYDNGPVLHAYGNHDLYNFGREELGRRLGVPFVEEDDGALVGYRSYVPPGTDVRVVLLDAYDVAVLDRPVGSSKRTMADEILTTHNSNYLPDNVDSGNSPEGLVGVDRRYVAFNGAFGARQLAWLRVELAEADRLDQRVVVLSHTPLHPESANPVCIAWNFEEVTSILREHRRVVAASLSGHGHRGGYARDNDGVHYRMFECALESAPPVKTYAVVEIYQHELRVRGYGDCESASYDLNHLRRRPKRREKHEATNEEKEKIVNEARL